MCFWHNVKHTIVIKLCIFYTDIKCYFFMFFTFYLNVSRIYKKCIIITLKKMIVCVYFPQYYEIKKIYEIPVIGTYQK